MHYKNGRPVNLGDKVVGLDCGGNLVAGTVVTANAGATSCNVQVVPPGVPTLYATAGELLHVEDALQVTPPQAGS